MMMKINKDFMTAEDLNTLYAIGYRFYTEGDYTVTDRMDPWSGMPITTNNLYVFTDKIEAEGFAKMQVWVFNPTIHATVKEIPAHTETREEKAEKETKKRAERKAKREARKNTNKA